MREYRKWIAAGVLLLFAVLSIILGLQCRRYARMLLSQQAAERWQGDSEMRFAQISCFRPVGQEVGLTELDAFRAGLDGALSEASLETTEDLRLWTDAYSTLTTLRVQGTKTTIETDAYAVGGEFFFFHPMTLLSGSYFAESDLARDRVVLTRELAWALFGAVDVAGMEVVIDSTPYLVAGVVDPDSDPASTAARAGGLALYLPYDRIYAYTDRAISCYELVLADPISDFAKNVVETRFPALGEVLENSRRYELGQIWTLLSDYGQRSMNVSGVLYPTWENAARYTEDMMALFLVLTMLTALLPVGALVFLVVVVLRRLKTRGKRVANRLRDRFI